MKCIPPILRSVFAVLAGALSVTAAPGDLDVTFGGTGKIVTPMSLEDDTGFDMVIQPDGKILVVGSATNSALGLVRYLSNGSLDPDFNGAGRVIMSTDSIAQLRGVALQSNGKVIVAGIYGNQFDMDFAYARFTTTGVDDVTFGTGGGRLGTAFAGFEQGYDLVVQSDDKFVITGFTRSAGSDDFAVSRYTSNGALDTTFNGTGKVVTDFSNRDDYGYEVVVLADGKTLVVGASSGDFAMARYNMDGSLDSSFGTSGKVITDMGGVHDGASSVALLGDGSLDATFGTGGRVTTDSGFGSDALTCIAVQDDGRIVVGGYATNGQYNFEVLRYNSDGSPDPTFHGTGRVTTDFGANSFLYGLGLQSDGKIVVAGYTTINGKRDYAVARYLGRPDPPVVATGASTNLSETSTKLAATINPNGAETTVYFEYGETPGFWSSSTSQALSAIPTANAVEITLIGLIPTTTYYYRVAATNSAGTSYGTVSTFTTPGPPRVVTGTFTPTSATAGVLAGTVNPYGVPTVAHFEYGLTDSYGISTGSLSAGTANAVTPFQQVVSGLLPNRVYHFRLVASSGPVPVLGNDATFLSDVDIPTVATSAPTGIGTTGATLRGAVNPNESDDTMVQFQYGPTTSYGSATTAQAIARGNIAVPVQALVSGLTTGVGYHYRLVATNRKGTSYGEDVLFTPSSGGGIPNAPPSVTTGGVTGATTTSAILQGVANPNGGLTDVHFEYGLTAGYGSATSSLSIGNGDTPANVSLLADSLLPGTEYHYRIIAVNGLGTVAGNDATFTTAFLPPVATTGGSAPLTTTSARLTGSVRARNASTAVFFDYGTDGVNFPTSVATTPPSVTGDTETAVTADLTGLQQGVTYHYRLRAVSSGGTTTGSVVTLQVEFLSGLLRQFPLASPDADGFVLVNLTPSGLLTGWRFIGEQQWRASGVPVGGLTTGDREIEFRPVPGYIHPPQELVAVISGEAATVLTRDYYETAVTGSGGLSVTLKPDSIISGTGRAQWRLLGEDDTQWRDSGTTAGGLIPGSYLVECKPVTGRATPPAANVLISAGQTSAPTITYFLADSQTGTPPSVLAFESVTTDQTRPYAYVGQIRSNVGSSTGFVVKARVVATAGHVVWDDGTLSAAQGLQWLFQRHRGLHEPKPITPRGFYLFDGYAAQRQIDNSPGTSSPQSQHLDVAALYFDEDAGRGGYGGFLASDLNDNEFLLSSAQKMLVGYPVNGIATTSQGRMHATAPANVVFTAAFGRTFTTTGIRSSGGNSGGPLCVQFESGNYYPAAIYLGGTNQTVVRAIDSAVIDLFNRAEVSGNGGGNNTGGGITHTGVTGILSPANPGTLQVNIEPAAARAAGAGWTLSPSINYRQSTNQITNLNPATYKVLLIPVAGYQPPAVENVSVTGGQVNIYTYTYALPVVLTAQETWRQANFGSSANSGSGADAADPDLDGFDNADEYTAGTNPNSATDVFKVASAQKSGSTFTLTTAGKTGRTYILERNATLGGTWDTITTAGPLGSDGTVTLTDPATLAGQAFYRIQVTGP